MSNLPPKILQSITNEFGPVVADFTITQTPQGGAPKHIREQWIDVPLPVRELNLAASALRSIGYDHLTESYNEIDQPISVYGLEALDALAEAGRLEAAQFWAQYQFALLTFRAFEGTLAPRDTEA